MKNILVALLFLMTTYADASGAARVNTACSKVGDKDVGGGSETDPWLYCTDSLIWKDMRTAPHVTYDVVVKKNDTVIFKQTIITLDGLPAVLEDAVAVTPYTSTVTITENTKAKITKTEEVKDTLKTGITLSLVPRIIDNKILTGFNFSSSHLNQMNKATVDGHTVEMPDVSRVSFNSVMALEPNKPVTQQVDAYTIQVSVKI